MAKLVTNGGINNKHNETKGFDNKNLNAQSSHIEPSPSSRSISKSDGLDEAYKKVFAGCGMYGKSLRNPEELDGLSKAYRDDVKNSLKDLADSKLSNPSKDFSLACNMIRWMRNSDSFRNWKEAKRIFYKDSQFQNFVRITKWSSKKAITYDYGSSLYDKYPTIFGDFKYGVEENLFPKLKKRRRTKHFFAGLGTTIGLVAVVFSMILLISPETIPYTKQIIYYTDDGREYGLNVHLNEKYQIQVPQKTGYSFDGLYEVKDNGDYGEMVVDSTGKAVSRFWSLEDHKYKAKYHKANYYIKLKDLDNTVIGFKDQTIEFEGNISDIAFTSATKTGYKFLGFSNDGETLLTDEKGKFLEGMSVLNEVNYDFSDPYAANETYRYIYLKPVYEGNEYTVTLDLNDTDDTENPAQCNQKQATVKMGSSFTFPVPDRGVEYSFLYWYDQNNKQLTNVDGESVIGAWESAGASQTVYAKWQKKAAGVYFGNCGNENELKEENLKPGATIRMKTPMQLKGREHDIFKYWKLVGDENGKEYKVDDGYTVSGGSNLIQFEAVWDDDGYEYIKNVNELRNVSFKYGENKKYCLADDIDLSGIANWEPLGGKEEEWTSSFDYILCGGNHTIRNLKRTKTFDCENGLIGLFGKIGKTGKVCNLKLENVYFNFTGENGFNGKRTHCGAVAGINNGTIENVTVSGKIYSDCWDSNGDQWTGGIAGVNYGGTIKNCTNYAEVYSCRKWAYAGGIAGMAKGTNSILNCVNKGSVTALGGCFWGGNAWASGIVAQVSNNTTISGFSNSGAIKGATISAFACSSNNRNASETYCDKTDNPGDWL